MYQLLFIDDEPIYKLTIQNLLDWSAQGFSIIGTASNGADALAFLESNEVHGIITDLQMPVMDGVTLIKALRRQGFSGPILALSNYSDYALVRGALIAGAYDYLIKIDITAEQMAAALQQMTALLRETYPDLSAPAKARQQEPSEDVCLRDFLSSPLELELPESIQQLLPKQQFPLTVCSVFFPDMPPNKTIQHPFLINMFREAFQGLSFFLPASLQEHELVFVLSAAEAAQKQMDLPAKLNTLCRQIKTFLSITPLISAANAEDLPGMKQAYQLCRRSDVRWFYSRTPGILFLPVELPEGDFFALRDNFISSAIASLRSQNSVEFQLVVNSFLSACGRLMVPASTPKEFFTVLIWCANDLRIISASPEETRSAIQKVESSTSGSELCQAVVGFFADYSKSGSNRADPVRPEIAKAMLYINKAYVSKITLNDVAGHVGLNREYFSRLFLKETGINLFQYITDVRMRKAAELLSSDPTILVKEVALSVGYDNPYFFSRRFKEYYGDNPNTYKEKGLSSIQP